MAQPDPSIVDFRSGKDLVSFLTAMQAASEGSTAAATVSNTAPGTAATAGTATTFSAGDHNHGPGFPATVNALGVKTTTATLLYGINTLTLTGGDACAITLPAVAVGARCIAIITNGDQLVR